MDMLHIHSRKRTSRSGGAQCHSLATGARGVVAVAVPRGIGILDLAVQAQLEWSFGERDRENEGYSRTIPHHFLLFASEVVCEIGMGGFVCCYAMNWYSGNKIDGASYYSKRAKQKSIEHGMGNGKQLLRVLVSSHSKKRKFCAELHARSHCTDIHASSAICARYLASPSFACGANTPSVAGCTRGTPLG